VLVDGLLVESIDLRCLGRSSNSADLCGHLVKRGPGALGEEDLRPFAGEGTSHRSAD